MYQFDPSYDKCAKTYFIIANFQIECLGIELRLIANHACWEIHNWYHVTRLNVGEYILVEKFQNQRDAVGEYEMLGNKLELIDVTELEVFQQEKQNRRH